MKKESEMDWYNEMKIDRVEITSNIQRAELKILNFDWLF